MPVFELPERVVFPDPELAEPEGLLAVGGDLSPRRLLVAYSLGIFPWYSDDDPILWWSPDPRLVLEPRQLRVTRSLAKVLRKGRFEVKADTAFARVIERCAAKPRPGQRGTWIVDEMRQAYLRIHEIGYAHSVESWAGEELVGGLYGVSLGGMFFGESMFADRADASKVAFVHLVRLLRDWDFDLVDCQVATEHLVRFGARDIPRSEFLARLARSLAKPTRKGRWTLGEPRPGPVDPDQEPDPP